MHPPTSAPSAPPGRNQLHPSDGVRIRARSISACVLQARISSVHDVAGVIRPTTSPVQTVRWNKSAVYSSGAGYSAKSVMSAGPLNVTSPVWLHIATFSTVMSE